MKGTARGGVPIGQRQAGLVVDMGRTRSMRDGECTQGTDDGNHSHDDKVAASAKCQHDGLSLWITTNIHRAPMHPLWDERLLRLVMSD